MPQFKDAFPDPDTLLKIEPEEVGALLITYFNSSPYLATNLTVGDGSFDQGAFLKHCPEVNQYAGPKLPQVTQAFLEGWAWLEREGLITRKPDPNAMHFVVTRRGHRIRTHADAETYKRANLLREESLHPILAQKVTSLFLRGDYDTAVFQAFKEIEVRVRVAARLQPTDLGTDLMRKAFHAENGPLSDQWSVKAERDSMSNLFAGAIGLFKNPQSHRKVETSAVEASQLINFASYLLGLVDQVEARAAIQKEDVYVDSRS